MVEQQVAKIYTLFSELPPSSKSFLSLQRERHVEYLTRGLRMLTPSFASLDANRPWLCYWISHSISLLEESIEPEMEDDVINILSRGQDPCGGYGWGPGQVASILNILDDELVKDVGCDILSCRTYEGDIAAEPGSEALVFNLLDLPRLVDWLVFRQGVQRGFQGRTNKLVDGCYFWLVFLTGTFRGVCTYF